LRKLAVEHGKLEATRETIISENARKYGNLSHVLEDGLEALQEIYETYNDRVVTQKHDLEAHDRQSTDLLNQLGALKERRERDVRLHGKSTAESEAQAKRLSDRAKNLAEIVGQHPEIGPLPPDLAAVAAANGAGATIDDPAAVAAAEEVRGRAHSRLKQLSAAAANLRAKNRREDDAAGAEVDIASRALAAAEESMRLRNEQRNAKRARADEVSADLSALSVSDASVAELKQRMAGAERDFEDRRCAGTSVNVAAEIEAKAEEVIALERKLAKLRSEAAAAAAAGENALKMRLKREELFGKEDQCKTLLESRAGRLASVFGGAAAVPAAAQLKPALRTVIDTRVRAMDASRVDAGNAASAARNAASGLAAATATAERLQGEVADAEARAAAEGDLLPEPPGTPALSQVPRSRFAAYASAVTESDAAVTESEHDLAVLNNLSLVYTSFHDKAAIDQCCPLCTRGFESIARTDEFKALIASRINTIPAQKEEMTVAVASAKHRRSRLQSMGPLAAHHASLVSKAVPEAADAIAAAETRVAETKTASATADEAADRAKADHVSAAALAEDADTITRLANEAADIRTAVESLERSFGASQMTQGGGAGGGALGTQGHQARTPSAIAGDIEDVEESKSAVEKEKEGLVRRRERAESELLSLERAAYSLREEHMRAAAKSDRRTQLKRELADIERDEKQADADATRQAAERAPKEAARNHLAAERKGARDRAVAAEAEADNYTRSLQRDLDALDAADRPITDYVLGGKAAALEQLKGSMSATDGRIAECNEQFGMISGRRKTKQDGISKAESMKRELDDNISYLKGKQNEDRLTAEVDALVLQMRAAGADVGTLEANLRRQVITRDKLKNEYAESQGRVSTHKDAMDGYQKELTDPQYKGVGKRLSKQVVELKTYEMVNQDLDRYHPKP
jgi:DNA repair protein RAD50